MENLNLNEKNLNSSHFLSFYKNNKKIEEYRIKRNNYINKFRQEKRQYAVDLSRNLINEDGSNADKLEIKDDIIDKNDLLYASNYFYSKKLDSKKKFSNIMMLAEWFYEIPDNFYDEYVLKLCPYGSHVLFICKDNMSYIVNKAGTIIENFKCSLSGGGMAIGSSKPAQTIFDCIYDKPNKKLFLLDVVYYHNRDFRDMTASSRFEWLEYIYESEFASYFKSSNDISFAMIEKHSCDDDNLRKYFKLKPPYEVDGVLSYWLFGHYDSGSTFFATWFKPYMIPELFGYEDIHEDYIKNLPMDYEDFKSDIIKYNENHRYVNNKKKDKMIVESGDVIVKDKEKMKE